MEWGGNRVSQSQVASLKGPCKECSTPRQKNSTILYCSTLIALEQSCIIEMSRLLGTWVGEMEQFVDSLGC